MSNATKDIIIRKMRIYSDNSAFIGIHKSIIEQLKITEDDDIQEEITSEGILLRVKRRAA